MAAQREDERGAGGEGRKELCSTGGQGGTAGELCWHKGGGSKGWEGEIGEFLPLWCFVGGWKGIRNVMCKLL